MNREGVGMMVVWIFVMIAGGLIITLFVVFTMGIDSTARQGLSLQALQQVDSILVTQQAATDTFTVINIPPEPITMTCDPVQGGYISEMRIGGLAENHEYRLVVGRSMNTEQLITFTRRAMIPFNIGNIVYLTNDQEALLVTGADALESQIDAFINHFPPPVQDLIYTQTNPNLDASQLQTVRSVRFRIGGPDLSENPVFSYPRKPQAALYIEVVAESPQELLERGYVRFHTYEDGTPGKKYYYSGTPMLLAYIWAGEEQAAECHAQKIATRIRSAASLHAERVEVLRQEAIARTEDSDISDACTDRYQPAQIRALKEAAQVEESGDVFADLPQAVLRVRQQNHNLVAGVRCATIY